MNNHFLRAIMAFCAIALLACNAQENPKAGAILPLKTEHSEFSKRQCANQSTEVCAEFKISYPIFSGGESATVSALNKSVQDYVLSAVAGDGQLPFAQALDSAAWNFVEMFKTDLHDNPEMTMGYFTEIKDSVPLVNSKVATVQMDGYAYTGGAHPNPFGLLVSYDLKKGAKPLEITDLVRDTNALRPLLEKAYKISKGLKETDPLGEMVYPDIKQLPMPANVGVAKEGIRFFYNAYEVAPYAVGASDVLVTWEQLGPLADKASWMD